MIRPLTPRQAEILQLIKDYQSETGMPPTRAEIAVRLGFKSANAAEENLRIELPNRSLSELPEQTERQQQQR